MRTKELIIRYLILIPGIFILCFGIAFITKAGLGTSPIASIPYSLSLILPRFTMGNYMIAINLCLLIAQWFMLHGKPYNLMRVLSDSSMVAIAAILCLVFLHALSGVREGTVICALLTGNIVKLYRLFLPSAKGPAVSS